MNLWGPLSPIRGPWGFLAGLGWEGTVECPVVCVGKCQL